MKRLKMLAEIRRLVGNVAESEVSNSELESDLATALEWIADELKIFQVETSLGLLLQANVQSYPMPGDVSRILRLGYAGKTSLKATSTYEWDGTGWDWKNATAGVPLEYAFEGRELIFDRKPSAATVASYPRATVKYQSSSPGISPAGVLRLAEADARLAITHAAMRWCMAHPDEKGVNQRRVANYQALLAMDLPRAKARAGHPIETLAPRRRVVSGRQGANR